MVPAMPVGSAWLWLGTVAAALLLNVLLYVLHAIRTRRHFVHAFKEFPTVPCHWLRGTQFPSRQSLVEKTTAWANQYRDAYVFWVAYSWCYIRLTSPDTIKAVLSSSDPKEPFSYKFIKPFTGDGLLLSKGKKWARNRRLLTPAFHFDILRPYVRTFSECTLLMMDQWTKAQQRGEESVEMFGKVSLMTLDSLMKCIFGVHDMDTQGQGDNHPYIQAVYRMSDLVYQRFRRIAYLNDYVYYFSLDGFRFRKQVNVAKSFTRSVIDAKIKDRGAANDGRKYLSFLEILLDCKDSDGQGLSYQEICDEVDTFMFEGHDTTASGISWFLYNLASHPDIQQKCREEVMGVLGNKEHVEWSDIPKFEYLTQCLKESLRLHPPVPSINRILTKPLTFPDGRAIPKGTRASVGVYNMHHNKHVWKDPEVYDPNRFSAENSKGRHPYAFIAFSAGPRNCIGQHFAYNELKTCAALVLRRFRLSVAENRKPPIPIELVTLKARNGIWLKCTPIQANTGAS